MNRTNYLSLLAVVATSWIAGCGTETPATTPPITARKVPADQADAAPSLSETAAEEVNAEVRDMAAVERLRSVEQSSLADTTTDALGRIGSATVPALVARLQQSDSVARQRALRILARIGPAAKDAVPAIIGQLRDPDEKVRKLAVRALGQIGPNASAAVPELMRIFDEGVEEQPVR
jgi:HEAT repeat protein